MQSEKPIYGEGEGSLVLKPYGQTFAAQSFENGAWTPDKGTITFTPSGQHYTVTTDKDGTHAEALFADMGQGFAMLQFNEAGKPSTYVLVEMQKDVVTLRPLMCSDLKKGAGQSDVVSYKDSDCTLTAKPGADDIKAWALTLGDAKMRMKVVK